MAKSLVSDELLKDHLLSQTHKLLTSIYNADWETYKSLVDVNLSSFEPEGGPALIEGLPFHKFFFENLFATRKGGQSVTTVAHGRVKLLGKEKDSALVTFLRLVQVMDGDKPVVHKSAETRLWNKTADGSWKLVHFHRSHI